MTRKVCGEVEVVPRYGLLALCSDRNAFWKAILVDLMIQNQPKGKSRERQTKNTRELPLLVVSGIPGYL